MTICQLLGTKQVSAVRISTGVCIKRVEFREYKGLSTATKTTFRKNEVSVLSGCP